MKIILNKEEREQLYALALSAKIGEIIECPSCGDAIIKKTETQKFCSNICKNNYHNKK